MRSFLGFFLLSVLCLLSGALRLPVYPSRQILELRSSIDVPSKTYRKTAEKHHYAYRLNRNGQFDGRIKLPKSARKANGAVALAVAKIDADHIYEKQALRKHLKNYGVKFKSVKKLPEAVRVDLKKVINSEKNLAPISASINRGKGATIRFALAGKEIKRKDSRDRYMKVTYPTARRIAQKVDQVYAKHKIATTMTAEQHLENTFRKGGLLKANELVPAASVGNSPEVVGAAKGKGKRKASPPGSPTPHGRGSGTSSGYQIPGPKKNSQGSSSNAGASGGSSGSPPRKKTRSNTGRATRK